MLWPKPPLQTVVTRVALELPTDQVFTRTGRHLLTLSADGQRLVYVANQQLYLREMRDLATTLISGTEGSDPVEPLFSPDGQSVAFWSKGELKKVPVTGGTPVRIAAVQIPFGASWVGDQILLGQSMPRGIVAVPASGGEPKVLVSVDEAKEELAHGPQLLAGGRAVLFTLMTGVTAWDASAIVLQELATGKRQVLVNGGTDARVLPSGHLVYSREATLFALPFDAARLAVTGSPVPVQEGIQQTARVGGGQSGAAQVAWSDQGTFVFVPGSTTSTVRSLVWIDRQGQEEPASAPERPYLAGSALRISPDGSQVALSILPESQSRVPATTARSAFASDLWVWHIARGSLTRLTFTGRAFTPIWTPDGQRICHDDGSEAFCQAADGRGRPESIFHAEGLSGIRAFAPDGSRVLFTKIVKNASDIMMATVGAPVEIHPLLQSAFSESAPVISPDGLWVAYASNESGRLEVYVRPFPAVEQGRWQVSTGGGADPRWSRNGRELFFTVGGAGSGPPTFLAVPVRPGASFVAGKPAVVLKLPTTSSFAYDVAPDGRFLLHRDASAARAGAERPKIVMVQHWFEELKARVPVSKWQ